MTSRAKKFRPIPEFQTEDEEREFWATHDSTDFIDWSQAKPVQFPNLKPTLKTISIRIPETLLNELKVMANRRGIPYQSLLKLFLSERVDEELKKAS
jgi:predicted DNA binding CopG/RHH family protein